MQKTRQKMVNHCIEHHLYCSCIYPQEYIKNLGTLNYKYIIQVILVSGPH